MGSALSLSPGAWATSSPRGGRRPAVGGRAALARDWGCGGRRRARRRCSPRTRSGRSAVDVRLRASLGRPMRRSTSMQCAEGCTGARAGDGTVLRESDTLAPGQNLGAHCSRHIDHRRAKEPLAGRRWRRWRSWRPGRRQEDSPRPQRLRLQRRPSSKAAAPRNHSL